MFSTLKGPVPSYVGVDLTDRYSKGCRDIDVCGLTRISERELGASFWFWPWDIAPKPLEVGPIARELAQTKSAMFDGPQALAAPGASIRLCERKSAAVGKTPDSPPEIEKPSAGFICSSLDIFDALKFAGLDIGPPTFLDGISEVYPGHIWTLLAGDQTLPKKSTDEGRSRRKNILQALGVSGLPAYPTHDQNDACLAALMAAAADGQVRGITVKGIGSPLSIDGRGRLREGLMAIPDVAPVARESIAGALHKLPVVATATSRNVSVPPLRSAPGTEHANHLLSRFINKASTGEPEICTYSWAYRHLIDPSCTKWSQAYANAVIKLSLSTPMMQLPGLGAVRLDTFIVSKGSRVPSNGHWDSASYDREDWERTLGAATLLQ